MTKYLTLLLCLLTLAWCSLTGKPREPVINSWSIASWILATGQVSTWVDLLSWEDLTLSWSITFTWTLSGGIQDWVAFIQEYNIRVKSGSQLIQLTKNWWRTDLCNNGEPLEYLDPQIIKWRPDYLIMIVRCKNESSKVFARNIVEWWSYKLWEWESFTYKNSDIYINNRSIPIYEIKSLREQSRLKTLVNWDIDKNIINELEQAYNSLNKLQEPKKQLKNSYCTVDFIRDKNKWDYLKINFNDWSVKNINLRYNKIEDDCINRDDINDVVCDTQWFLIDISPKCKFVTMGMGWWEYYAHHLVQVNDWKVSEFWWFEHGVWSSDWRYFVMRWIWWMATAAWLRVSQDWVTSQELSTQPIDIVVVEWEIAYTIQSSDSHPKEKWTVIAYNLETKQPVKAIPDICDFTFVETKNYNYYEVDCK